jgi:hypothetical protein
MKPWMKSTFDSNDESEDDAGSDFESEFEFPKLLVDIDGKKKFIMNKNDEEKLGARFRLATTQEVPSRKSHGTIADFITSKVKDNTKSIARRKHQKHGLAPFGMSIPVHGQAFMVGGGYIGKKPLKESNNEMYIRIQKLKEKKKEHKEKKVIKNLKKMGKVRSLSPFMVDA